MGRNPYTGFPKPVPATLFDLNQAVKKIIEHQKCPMLDQQNKKAPEEVGPQEDAPSKV